MILTKTQKYLIESALIREIRRLKEQKYNDLAQQQQEVLTHIQNELY